VRFLKQVWQNPQDLVVALYFSVRRKAGEREDHFSFSNNTYPLPHRTTIGNCTPALQKRISVLGKDINANGFDPFLVESMLAVYLLTHKPN
jgi:hypothetical protein